MIWLTNAAAWLRERSLWVVFGLVAIVSVLSYLLQLERTNRKAAEALAKWERAIGESQVRRRVRDEAAQLRRDMKRAKSMRERWLAYRAADDRRREIYAAGDDLGRLFDRTFRPGRRP